MPSKRICWTDEDDTILPSGKVRNIFSIGDLTWLILMRLDLGDMLKLRSLSHGFKDLIDDLIRHKGFLRPPNLTHHVLTYPDVGRIVFTMYNGELNGPFVLTLATGESVKGLYKNGKRHGRWVHGEDTVWWDNDKIAMAHWNGLFLDLRHNQTNRPIVKILRKDRYYKKGGLIYSRETDLPYNDYDYGPCLGVAFDCHNGICTLSTSATYEAARYSGSAIWWIGTYEAARYSGPAIWWIGLKTLEVPTLRSDTTKKSAREILAETNDCMGQDTILPSSVPGYIRTLRTVDPNRLSEESSLVQRIVKCCNFLD